MRPPGHTSRLIVLTARNLLLHRIGYTRRFFIPKLDFSLIFGIINNVSEFLASLIFFMSKISMKKPTAVSAEFIEKMKAELTREKERLEKELSNFATLNRNAAEEDFNSKFPKYGDEEGDNAQEVADYEANLSIEQGLEKLLRDVNSALARVLDGSYGTCKYCKKSIEEKRLLARPTSSACVDCKKTIVQEA